MTLRSAILGLLVVLAVVVPRLVLVPVGLVRVRLRIVLDQLPATVARLVGLLVLPAVLLRAGAVVPLGR